MAIKLKRINSNQDSFYKLDEKTISDGTKPGSKTKESGLLSKMTSYSKNVLKSTANLTYDVIGDLAPNIKDIREQIQDVATETTEESRKIIGDIVSFGKKKLSGSGDFKGTLKKTLSDQKKDILGRLKSGKIYMTEAERAEEAFSKDFDLGGDDFDFNSDFGDDNFNLSGDSYVTSEEDDILAEQPFASPVKKGRTTKRNISAERRAQVRKSNVNKAKSKGTVKFNRGGSRTGEVRLGDELVSNTTSEVGSQLLSQNEELWARSYAADESRFSKTVGIQTSILTSVKSIEEFQTSIISENVKAQVEFQAKQIAASEDIISLAKEIKDSIIVTSTYKTPEIKSGLLNGNRLDTKKYSEQIKQNFSDLLSSSGFGSIAMMSGMLPSMLNSDIKIGGSFDPLSMVLRNAPKIFMSGKTRAKFNNLNKNLESFGAGLLGKMNEWSEYESGWKNKIGKLLGNRSTKVTIAKVGLDNPNEVVGWTAKASHALTEVIPTLLSRQLSQVKGIANKLGASPTEELYYDYRKGGGFKTLKSLQEKQKISIDQAYSNATIQDFEERMVYNAVGGDDKLKEAKNKARKEFNDKKKKGLIAEDAKFSFDAEKWQADTGTKLREAFKIMNKNATAMKIPVDLIRLETDKAYQEKITNGVDDEIKSFALGAYTDAFAKMTGNQRNQFNNAGILTAAQNVQQKLDQFSSDIIVNGGAAALQEVSRQEELKERINDLSRNRDYVINENAGITDYANTQRMGKKAEALIAIKDMINQGIDPNDPVIKTFLEAYPDLDKSIESLKRNQSITARKQKNYADATSSSVISMLFGDKLLNSGYDKFAGGTADFINGMYNNLIGTRGEYGEGLGESDSIDEITRQYLKSNKERLQKFREGTTYGILHKIGGNKLDVAASKIDERFSKAIENNKFVNEENKWDINTDAGAKNLANIKSLFIKKYKKYKNKLSEVYDSVTKVGLNGTLELYKEEIDQDPKFKEFIEFVAKHMKTVRPLFEGQHFAKGGVVHGPESGDQVNIKANGGETIFTKAQTKVLGLAASGKIRIEDAYRNGKNKFDNLYSNYKQNKEYHKNKPLKDDVSSIKDALENLGLSETRKLYADRIKENPEVSKLIDKVYNLPLVKSIADYAEKSSKVIVNRIKSRNIGPEGEIYAIDSKRRRFGSALSKTLGVAGAAAGLAVGHPILGAALGAGVGKGIGSLFKKRFPKLKGAMLAAGYVDAAHINYFNEPDLYAMIVNMANSQDPIEREKGRALMMSDEWPELEKRSLKRTPLQMIKKVGKDIKKFVTNRINDGKMIIHRTLKYKKLINVLDPRFSKNGVNLFDYDKEGLYAMIRTLPERTEDDKKYKASIMSMKEYKKLDNDVMNYQSILDKGKAAIKDISQSLVRHKRHIKLYKYRYLASMLMQSQGRTEKEFYNDIQDAPMLYGSLVAHYAKSKDPNDQQVWKVLKSQKIFQTLELDVMKQNGASDKEIAKKKEKHARQRKNRQKYSGIMYILDSTYDGPENKKPDFYSMEKEELFNAINSAMRKHPDIQSIKSSKLYQLLERECGQRDFDKIDAERKSKSLFNRIKMFSNKTFGTNFDTVEMERLGDEEGWSRIGTLGKEYGENLAEDIRENRRMMNGKIKGKARRAMLNATVGKKYKKQKFAKGGIVNGPYYGDNVDISVDGGEMILNRKQQTGLYGFINKLFGKNDGKIVTSNDRLSGILKGQTDTNASKAIKFGGPMMAMVTYLSQMNRTLAATLKTLGGNDKGEIDEKNSETIAGQINNSKSKNNKSGKSASDIFKNTFFKENKGKGLQNAAGIISALGIAATAGGIVKNISSANKEAEKHGFVDGLMTFLGLNSASRKTAGKSNKEQALDRLGDAANRNITHGIVSGIGSIVENKAIMEASIKKYGKRKAAKMIKNNDIVLKKAGGLAGQIRNVKDTIITQKQALTKAGSTALEFTKKSSKNVAKSIGKSTKKAATAAGEHGLNGALKSIEGMLKGFFENKKILGSLKACGKSIGTKGLSKLKGTVKTIVERIKSFSLKKMASNATNAAKNSLKAVPIAGWIAAIAGIIADISMSINDAPSKFGVAPTDCTAGMKATAGIVGGIKSLIVNALAITGVGAVLGMAIDVLLPEDWMINLIYKCFVSKEAFEELESKRDKMNDIGSRIGKTGKELAEAENTGLFAKAWDGIKAAFNTNKTYEDYQDERKAKDLGISVNDYKSLVKEDMKTSASEYQKKKAALNESIEKNDAKSYIEKTKVLSRVANGELKFVSGQEAETLRKEWETLIKMGDIDAATNVILRAKNDGEPAQMNDKKYLNSEMQSKFDKLNNEWNAKHDKPLVLNETKRSLSTQMAYYAKGRGKSDLVDAVLKAAGFSNGLGFWAGDNREITQTLNSKHMLGNAFDIRTQKMSKSDLEDLANIAAKNDIEWGGDWAGFNDDPHFQKSNGKSSKLNSRKKDIAKLENKNDNIVKAARGGIIPGNHTFGDKINARLNSGEMVLNKIQQTALFKAINSLVNKDKDLKDISPMTKLKESPMKTNMKNEIEMINEALSIQKAIYAEQVRHNKIAEEFFNAIMKAFTSFTGAPIKTQNISISEVPNQISQSLLNDISRIASGI